MNAVEREDGLQRRALAARKSNACTVTVRPLQVPNLALFAVTCTFAREPVIGYGCRRLSRYSPKAVRLCRRSEMVLDLLPAQRRQFINEDGERVIDDAGRRVATA